MMWAWKLVETSVNTYCELFAECSFRGVIIELSHHFFTSVYKMIFEWDSPFMSKEAIEELINIMDWYVSPSNTFIQMYDTEKPLHVLPKFSMDKLFVQEVSYHILAGLSIRVHPKKKAPWPTLLLRIRLYEIWNFKHADVETEEIKKYPLYF